MVRIASIIYAMIWLLFVAVFPARAERVVADLTSHRVEVKFEFSGANLTLFGAVVGKAGETVQRPDVVIVVRGPETPLIVRKKNRLAGIWINSESRTIKGLPGFFAIVSNRPLSKIASAQAVNQIALGDRTAQFKSSLDRTHVDGGDEFLQGLMRLKRNKAHYYRNPAGVEFVEDELFRADFRLPADVMTGDYTAMVHLFRDGKQLGSYKTVFDIEKTGLEGLVFRTAQERPFLYGILAVLAAAFAGLGASYIFRNS